MHALKTLIAAAVTATLLSGCVVSIHDDEMDFNHHDWKRKQQENREAISSLKMGATLDGAKTVWATRRF